MTRLNLLCECSLPLELAVEPGGRPSTLSADQVKTAQRLYAQRDMTVAQGDVLGVSRTTIYRVLNRQAMAKTPRRPRPAPPT